MRDRVNTAYDRTSQPDSLHLAQCNFVLGSVVEFGRSRRLMPGHLVGVLEPSVVLQVNRDARCPPGVTSKGGEKTRRQPTEKDRTVLERRGERIDRRDDDSCSPGVFI